MRLFAWLAFFALFIGSVFAIDINSCQNLNTAGATYNLISDVSSAGTCFDITANAITLDCHGHSITSSLNTNYGIQAGSLTGLNIKNCQLSNWTRGVSSSASISNFTNNTAKNSGDFGFYIFSADSNRLTNNTVIYSGDNSFDIDTCTNSTLIGNRAFNSGDPVMGGMGFAIVAGTKNSLFNNYAQNTSRVGFGIAGSDNNTLVGNVANISRWGFGVLGSYNNLNNNIAFDSNLSGFRVDPGAMNNLLLGNNANRSGEHGFVLQNNGYNRLIGNHAYNSTSAGFTLLSSLFNNLSQNTAVNSSYGFFVQSSNYNNISNNIVTVSNQSAFYLYSSSKNKLTNNTATDSIYYGIYLFSSPSNNLTFNRAFNSSGGFYLDASSNNYLTNNEAYYPIGYGSYVDNSQNVTLINNSVYNTGSVGFTLISDTNSLMINNSAYNSSLRGFELISSSNITLFANQAHNSSQEGFLFHLSSNCEVLDNKAFESHSIGYSIISSPSNLFIGNQAYNSTNDGFYLESGSHNNVLSNNFASNASWSGFALSFSPHTILGTNMAIDIGTSGFSIDNSQNVTLFNNTAENIGWSGFSLSYTNSDSLILNKVNNTGENGYFLGTSSGNSLLNNSVFNSNSTGFGLLSSQNNVLSNNFAYNSNSTGFNLDTDSNSNILVNNAANHSGIFGFYLAYNTGNNLTQNLANNSGTHGYYLVYDTRNKLINNHAINSNWTGFTIALSNFNLIVNNLAYNSTQMGFYLGSSSSNNNLSNNNATLNEIGYSIYTNSDNNSLANNSALSSNQCFNVFSGSNNNLNSNHANLCLTAFFFGSETNNNSVLLNNITSSTWVSDSGTGNLYNTSTSGNIYYFSNGTPSWQVYDIKDNNGDHWADTGTDRPFSSPVVPPYWINNGQDWHPYTENISTLVTSCEQADIPACMATEACSPNSKSCTDIADTFCSCECPQWQNTWAANLSDSHTLASGERIIYSRYDRTQIQVNVTDNSGNLLDWSDLLEGQTHSFNGASGIISIKLVRLDPDGQAHFEVQQNQCPSPHTAFNDSTCACICPDSQQTTLRIGQMVGLGGFHLRLVDVPDLSPLKAILDVLDANDQVIGQIQMSVPGQYTFTQSSTGLSIVINVLDAGTGLTAPDRWVQISYNPKDCMNGQPFDESTCTCQCDPALVSQCTAQGGLWNDTLCYCTVPPSECDQSAILACASTCPNVEQGCTALMEVNFPGAGEGYNGLSACRCDCPDYVTAQLNVSESTSFANGNFSLDLLNITPYGTESGTGHFRGNSVLYDAAVNQSFVLTNTTANQTLTILPVRNINFGSMWAEVSTVSDDLYLKDGYRYNLSSSDNTNWKNIFVSLLWKNKDASATQTQADHLREVTIYTDDISSYMGGDNRMLPGDNIAFPKAQTVANLAYGGLDLTESQYVSLSILSESTNTYYIGQSGDCNTLNGLASWNSRMIQVHADQTVFGGSASDLLGGDSADKFYVDPIGGYVISNPGTPQTQNIYATTWSPQIFWKPAGCTYYKVANISVSGPNLGKSLITSYSNAVKFASAGDDSSAPGLLKFYFSRTAFNPTSGNVYAGTFSPLPVGEIVLQEDAGKLNDITHHYDMLRMPVYNISTTVDWRFKANDASTSLVYYNRLNLSQPIINSLQPAQSYETPLYTERGTRASGFSLTDASIQVATQVAHPLFSFNANTYEFNTLITDSLDRTLDNRMNTLPEDNYTASLAMSDTSNILSPLRGVYENNQIARNLNRIGSDQYAGFADQTLEDPQGGSPFTYIEQQNFWTGSGMPAFDSNSGVSYSSNSNYRQVIATPQMLAYNMRFFGNPTDYGIPVCTGNLANPTDWTSCTDPRYLTSRHRLPIQFLGEQWMLMNMTLPTTPLVTSTGAVTGGQIKLAKEYNYNILSVGQVIYGDSGLSARLLASGTNSTHAHFEILDENGDVIGGILVPIGESYTYTDSSTGQTIRIHLYQTADGLPPMSEVRAYGPCPTPKTYNLTSCNCTCDLNEMHTCTESGGLWNDTNCSCSIIPTYCNQSIVPACFGTCSQVNKDCMVVPDRMQVPNSSCDCDCPTAGWYNLTLSEVAAIGNMQIRLDDISIAVTPHPAIISILDMNGNLQAQIQVPPNTTWTYTDVQTGETIYIKIRNTSAGLTLDSKYAEVWLSGNCPLGQFFNSTTCSCQDTNMVCEQTLYPACFGNCTDPIQSCSWANIMDNPSCSCDCWASLDTYGQLLPNNNIWFRNSNQQPGTIKMTVVSSSGGIAVVDFYDQNGNYLGQMNVQNGNTYHFTNPTTGETVTFKLTGDLTTIEMQAYLTCPNRQIYNKDACACECNPILRQNCTGSGGIWTESNCSCEFVPTTCEQSTFPACFGGCTNENKSCLGLLALSQIGSGGDGTYTYNISNCSCDCPGEQLIFNASENLQTQIIGGLTFNLDGIMYPDNTTPNNPNGPGPVFTVTYPDGTTAGLNATFDEVKRLYDPSTGQWITLKAVRTVDSTNPIINLSALVLLYPDCPSGQRYNTDICACECDPIARQNCTDSGGTWTDSNCSCSLPPTSCEQSIYPACIGGCTNPLQVCDINGSTCGCACDNNTLRTIHVPESVIINGYTVRLEDTRIAGQTGTAIFTILDPNGNVVGQIELNDYSETIFTDPATQIAIKIKIETVNGGLTLGSKWVQIQYNAKNCPTGQVFNETTCACECDPVARQNCADMGGTWDSTTCSCNNLLVCSRQQSYPNGTCGTDDCKTNITYGENYSCDVISCSCKCDPELKAACPPALWHNEDCTCESPKYCSEEQRFRNNSCGNDDCKFSVQFGADWACNTTTCSCGCDPNVDCFAPKSYKNLTDCKCQCDPVLKASCPPNQWHEDTCTCEGEKFCSRNQAYANGTCGYDDCKTNVSFGENFTCDVPSCSCQCDPSIECSAPTTYKNLTTCACACDPTLRSACPAARWHEDTCSCEPQAYCSQSQTYQNGTCGIDDCKTNASFGANFSCDVHSCSCQCDPKIGCLAPKDFKNQTTCACECDPLKRNACPATLWHEDTCQCEDELLCSLAQHYFNGTCGTDDCKTSTKYGENFTCDEQMCSCQCDPTIQCEAPFAKDLQTCTCVCPNEAVDKLACEQKRGQWDPKTCSCLTPHFCGGSVSPFDPKTQFCLPFNCPPSQICNTTTCSCGCDPFSRNLCKAPDVWNEGTCSCCPYSANLECNQLGGFFNQATCSCDLKCGNSSYDPSSGTCSDACSDYRFFVGGIGNQIVSGQKTPLGGSSVPDPTYGHWVSVPRVCAVTPAESCSCEPLNTSAKFCSQSQHYQNGTCGIDDCKSAGNYGPNWLCDPQACACACDASARDACPASRWNENNCTCEAEKFCSNQKRYDNGTCGLDDCKGSPGFGPNWLCDPQACACACDPSVRDACPPALWHEGNCTCEEEKLCSLSQSFPNGTCGFDDCKNSPSFGSNWLCDSSACACACDPGVKENCTAHGDLWDPKTCTCNPLFCGQGSDAGVCKRTCENTATSCLVDDFDPALSACMCECSPPQLLTTHENEREWVGTNGKYEGSFNASGFSDQGVYLSYTYYGQRKDGQMCPVGGSVVFTSDDGETVSLKLIHSDSGRASLVIGQCPAGQTYDFDLCMCVGKKVHECAQWAPWKNITSSNVTQVLNSTNMTCVVSEQLRVCLNGDAPPESNNTTECLAPAKIPCPVSVDSVSFGLFSTPKIYGSCPAPLVCDTSSGYCVAASAIEGNNVPKPGKHWWDY